MPEFHLSLNPGGHDPSAALFKDNELVFAVEEERYTRSKHAVGEFPRNAIEGCLDFECINLSDLKCIVVPMKQKLATKIWKWQLKSAVSEPDSIISKSLRLEQGIKNIIAQQSEYRIELLREHLRDIGKPLPNIEQKSHHKCHAASAFYPSGYRESLVLTIDGRGEYDSTVIWKGDETGLERLKTFRYPNSLGNFYGAITEFLGYRMHNGEGKIMGLAPYGEDNDEIENRLKKIIDTSADYDVTEITKYGADGATDRLEKLFDRSRKEEPMNFTQWEKDLSFVAQSILEEVVTNIIEQYTEELGIKEVALAGGVALNCKLNQVIQQSSFVDHLFVQPVAHDAGLALGGGMLMTTPSDVSKMNKVYWGPAYDDAIDSTLSEAKVNYKKIDDVTSRTAEYLANGKLVGWFQGRLELGPRALGHRSILADPRSVESRDKVNNFVKHREGWRPFAPSIKEEAIDKYLIDGVPSPFMIKTYDVYENKQSEIPAVLHPADGTTRPQTVSEDQNPRYHALISEFEDRTGVPAVLNTSFNDHAEPIVNHPTEAIKDFYGMGLDVLVLGNYIIEK